MKKMEYLLISHRPEESSREAVDQLEDGKETNVKIKWFWVISFNTTDLAKVKKYIKM